MAIAFAQVKYLSRSKALQATAAAAYRSCSKIYDERTGMTFDYTNKSSPLLYSEVLLPQNADDKFKDRALLWNTIEKIEVRRNSQVAKEVVLALPKDIGISDSDKIELAKQFSLTHFVNKGVAVDLNIHNETGNPHAHLLITTRRLIGKCFDSHKARDLDPKIVKKRVQIDKIWGEEWRYFQNQYFLAKGINLTVDANGICSQVHLGKDIFHSKDRENFDIWQINQVRQCKAREFSLTQPEAVLNQLSLHHSVFIEQDIERLLHKHLNDSDDFQSTLLKIKASPQLLTLGLGEDGKERFTTRALFELENQLQDRADQLIKRYSHPVNNTFNKKITAQFRLNEEQAKAISHLLQGPDLSILVGRAGTGKTYTLQAAKEAFEAAGYQVKGVALSGVAAQNLQDATGIPSRTIASFCYALKKETMKLSNKDVIILDEAGMTDVYTLSEVIQAVYQAKAKLILVGDDAQLQPIGPGAPFRALLERVGFAELNNIIRQEKQWQRTATHHFATGNVYRALQAYQDHKHIHFNKTAQNTMTHLINDWHYQSSKETTALSKVLILAHKKSDVLILNQMARAKRILAGEIDRGFLAKIGKQEIELSIKDRLLFLKNDSTLQVRNGQFGTLKSMQLDKSGQIKNITAELDNYNVLSFDPRNYMHFTHGYSATIHKAQGITLDHSFIYISGNHWNRNLMYVAGSRHRKNLDLYIDQRSYVDFKKLVKSMNRSGMKDSVLDYPVNFAKRRGIDVEALLNQIKQQVLGPIKSFKSYLQHKYSRLSPKKEKIADNHYKSERNNLEKIQIKFQTLVNNFTQAKEAKNPYKLYKIKRELHREIYNLQKNKVLYQTIKIQLPELMKVIQSYQVKQLEYEQDL